MMTTTMASATPTTHLYTREAFLYHPHRTRFPSSTPRRVSPSLPVSLTSSVLLARASLSLSPLLFSLFRFALPLSLFRDFNVDDRYRTAITTAAMATTNTRQEYS
ncbi:hypothetical protein PUN28_004065 [Cardiocondyla obscurior]|uniref:Uncharacterized protein n=1 Tax=Cardiocondyla obscurior TaxID=286306 RepID=A0AAW2GMV4_9HYME